MSVLEADHHLTAVMCSFQIAGSTPVCCNAAYAHPNIVSGTLAVVENVPTH